MPNTRQKAISSKLLSDNNRWAQAVEHLKRVDPRWIERIDQLGPCLLRPKRDRFGILVRAIIGQQISSKTAASIHLRLLNAQKGCRHRPELLQNLGETGMRQAGISGVKAKYLLNLAEAVQNGCVPLDRIGRLGDDEIIARLTTVKGIGPWTAEMFLIFALNRPDVLSIGDLGVRVGIRDHFELDLLPSPKECITLAEPWRPFRSIAMWYLWRKIDTPGLPDVQEPETPTESS